MSRRGLGRANGIAGGANKKARPWCTAQCERSIRRLRSQGQVNLTKRSSVSVERKATDDSAVLLTYLVSWVRYEQIPRDYDKQHSSRLRFSGRSPVLAERKVQDLPSNTRASFRSTRWNRILALTAGNVSGAILLESLRATRCSKSTSWSPHRSSQGFSENNCFTPAVNACCRLTMLILEGIDTRIAPPSRDCWPRMAYMDVLPLSESASR